MTVRLASRPGTTDVEFIRCPECGGIDLRIVPVHLPRADFSDIHCRTCDWVGLDDGDDGEPLGLDTVSLSELRTFDRQTMLEIAAGGGPRNKADHDEIFCRLCNCNKCGWAEEPNSVTEACEDPRCPCHSEDLP